MEPPVNTPITPDAPAGRRKVLCIEDERFISELYTRALTKGGYEVETIADGSQALTAAQTNKYDIILLDLMIPSLSGIEILRVLRDPATGTPGDGMRGVGGPPGRGGSPPMASRPSSARISGQPSSAQPCW